MGDAYDLFGELPAKSIDLIITSPPYWGHREYGLSHNWDFFNEISKTRKFGSASPGYEWYKDAGGVLGLEPFPEWYITHLVQIFSKSKDCLKDGGSMWINIGDTYFARWASIRENGRQGLADKERLRRKTPMGGARQEKQLLLIPSRFAIAMQEAGWILRNDLIWHKPNATPRPEGDRLKLAHEHFFHFVKRSKEGRPTYFYDVRQSEPRQSDVVSVNVTPGEEGHTATFPRNLVLPRILTSSPMGGVVLDPFCGTGRALEIAREFGREAIGFEKFTGFQEHAERKLVEMTAPKKSTVRPPNNYISEWFGRRIYPTVRLDSIKNITGANQDLCPFLSAVQAEKSKCWKQDNSKGVCSISSVSNGSRQDWLVCPHRVIHSDIVRKSCARIFGVDGDRYPIPVSVLSKPDRLAALKDEIKTHGRAFLFFQDKLGGEISVSGTSKSPEMAFDVTLVEVLQGDRGQYVLGRYGVMELQTMDFHGSYSHAVSALRNALDLHGDSFPLTLQSNIEWAGRKIEGPNIANVFKRTFYQIMIKFQLSAEGASAGTVLALPRSVWDSWQPFLGAPRLTQADDGCLKLEGAEDSSANAYICVFDLAANEVGEGGADGTKAKDISPVRTEMFIRVSPEMLSRHALKAVPEAMLHKISGTDAIMSSIRTRLSRLWPEIGGKINSKRKAE